LKVRTLKQPRRLPLTHLELYQSLFEPLEEAILDNSTESKLAILTFYTNILRQWTTSLISQDQQSPQDGPAISSLIDHANVLALTILQSSLTITTCSTVLTFYETIASLLSHPEASATARIIIPPTELIYTLFFTPSLSTLSRLCSILAFYKRAFEHAMSSTKSPVPDPPPYPREYVNHFNGFLMDICNCIWRSRAFNTSDTNALGCLLPAPTTALLARYVAGLDTSLSLPALFSLSFSPVLCRPAIAYVRELEDQADPSTIEVRHAGPVTQASLRQLERDAGLRLSWADYRLGVLRHLEKSGVVGVGELMYNTMKHLMTARENMA
jgi:centromere protein I